MMMGSGWAGSKSNAAPDGSRTATPALAVSIDGNGRRVAADPYRGTIEAALECAANLACVGASPLGTTNNLNFGNPEKPHIAWQMSESVRGLGDACRALEAPIVGGNVSLYNEGPAGPIYPTPVVGMVGSLPDAARVGQLGFAQAGDAIALVGPFTPSLAASELAKLHGRPLPDGLAEIDLDAVLAAQAAVREAVRAGVLSSAHDVAEGDSQSHWLSAAWPAPWARMSRWTPTRPRMSTRTTTPPTRSRGSSARDRAASSSPAPARRSRSWPSGLLC